MLKIPYALSPGWLKIDPNFDPLRKNPRFKRLIADGDLRLTVEPDWRLLPASTPGRERRGVPAGKLRLAEAD